MLKIAYCAGHYLGTAGKRIPAQLDANCTREWVLNDRVARYFAEAAEGYDDVQVYRTDDETGKTFLDIPERVAQANKWGADLYIDMHHNAAGVIFTGGGVEAFSYPGSVAGRKYRDAIYEAVVAAGGLKGNRGNPLQEKRFDSLSLSKMPAVLVEYGYMDSAVDAPIILTDAYAKKVGYATMDAIAKLEGLKKKASDADAAKIGYVFDQTEFIKEVQRCCGAKVDGIAGPETLRKTVTVSESKNRSHPVVRVIQRWLTELGYTQVGKVDGVAGVKFTAAVCAFQKANRCWVDGEITARNKTWKKLLGME
jgi:peptidoglycan hydrolase-like protein with peptidoglycan-binding domain